MTSHVFGGVWSGCAATYTVKDFDGYSARVKSVVENDLYVDDCLASFETLGEAFEVIHGVKSLLRDGGFNLTKFVANNADLLSTLSAEDRASEVKCLHSDSHSKVLGIKWDVWNDCLYFDVCLSEYLDKVTQRRMLSCVSSLFDPLGLIGPVLIGGKIL
jgi:hypothetical protein